MNKMIIIYTIIFLLMFDAVIGAACKGRKYNDDMYANANVLIEACKYEEAIPVLEELGEYRDANLILDGTRKKAEIEEMYTLGNEYLKNKRYLKAIEQFENVINYKDSASKIKEASYYLALDYMNTGENVKAKEYFIKADGYKDSVFNLAKLEILNEENAKRIVYKHAIQKYNSEEYTEAIELFELLENYKNSRDYTEKCNQHLQAF